MLNELQFIWLHNLVQESPQAQFMQNPRAYHKRERKAKQHNHHINPNRRADGVRFADSLCEIWHPASLHNST